MIILGIESSCDDTSVALIEASEKGFLILSEKTASQIDIHKKYGGVVPEIAGRKHAEAIVPLIEEVLALQHLNTTTHKHHKPDMIAVTAGPGLITGLLVGVETAKTLSYLWNVPLVAVNHIDGHIHSVEIPSSNFQSLIQFPALCLVVSGGHTELLFSTEHNSYSLIGKTRDDAAGECFDKVAKLLGLEYPGGPKISQFAAEGNPNAIPFPRPMLNEKGDFSAKSGPTFGWSFAGLKTAALYWLRDHPLAATKIHNLDRLPGITGTLGIQPNDPTIHDFCASFEQAIVDVLVGKTMRAVEQYEPKTVILAGGVAANKKLRNTLQEKLTIYNSTTFTTPTLQYCMDNAAMIAVAGYYKALKKQFTSWQDITVDPNWKAY